MRRFLSTILLILALCAALTTTALAMAVYPNSEFGDPGFHHETDFSGDDDFVVYFDPERDEFHVYENKIAEGFTAIPLDEALPFIARLVGRAALGVMVVVLLFRIAGTILLFVAFARRSKAIAWIGVGCILGTMALMPSLLALAAGIFGLVGASRMPELQTGLPVPDEAAQKGE